MKIVKKLIQDLLPADYNPRKDLQPTDNEYKQLKRSIEEFGYVEPIIYNIQTGVVVGGHQRLKVLSDLGYSEVDCVEVDIDITKEKALNIALNKISGDWDEDKLKDLLSELQGLDFDMDLTGFTAEDLSDLNLDISVSEEKVAEEDNFDITQDIPKRVNKGDLWRLGNHLLYCGDSLDSNSYKVLMGENKADMVFTDPPYGMKKEKDGVENDNLNFEDLLEFNKKWIPLTFEYTKENGSWYCWGIDEPLMDIYSNILKPMIKDNKITFRNLITWYKGNGQGQLSEEFRMYPIADEKCLFVMCGGAAIQGFVVNQDMYSEKMDAVRLYLESEIKKLNQSDEKIANALGYKAGRTVNHWYSKSQFALPTEENYQALKDYGCKVLNTDSFLEREYDTLKREFYEGRSYFDNTHDNMNNVWHFDRTSGEERALTGGHATPKPIALCSRGIKSSSRENEIVLDVFGGSGSTLIACEQLNRQCRMIELTEHYCDVIIHRWETLTGGKAEKVI